MNKSPYRELAQISQFQKQPDHLQYQNVGDEAILAMKAI